MTLWRGSLTPLTRQGVTDLHRDHGGPTITVERHTLSAGDAGIWQTIAHMRRLTDDAVRDPVVVMTARQIVRDVERDPTAQADAVLQWVHEHVKYVRDPVSYELLVPPRTLIDQVKLGTASEDCDSMSMLTAALLEAIGFETRFDVVSQSSPISVNDSAFEHVYTEVDLDGVWTSIDPSLETPSLGQPIEYTTRAVLGKGKRVGAYTFRKGQALPYESSTRGVPLRRALSSYGPPYFDQPNLGVYGDRILRASEVVVPHLDVTEVVDLDEATEAAQPRYGRAVEAAAEVKSFPNLGHLGQDMPPLVFPEYPAVDPNTGQPYTDEQIRALRDAGLTTDTSVASLPDSWKPLLVPVALGALGGAVAMKLMPGMERKWSRRGRRNMSILPLFPVFGPVSWAIIGGAAGALLLKKWLFPPTSQMPNTPVPSFSTIELIALVAAGAVAAPFVLALLQSVKDMQRGARR